MNQLSSRAQTLLSLPALLPALAMFALGSSMWWAPGNPMYAAFDQAMADAQFKAVFNLVSPAVILLGLALAAGLNLWPWLARRPGQPLAPANIAFVVAAGLLLALMIAYLIGENWACLIGVDDVC